MCNCYFKMRDKLVEHFKKKAPDGATEPEVEIHGYMYGIDGDGGLLHRATNNVTVRFEAPRKAGGMKKVVDKTYLRATYCPFCGDSYEESERREREALTGKDIDQIK